MNKKDTRILKLINNGLYGKLAQGIVNLDIDSAYKSGDKLPIIGWDTEYRNKK